MNIDTMTKDEILQYADDNNIDLDKRKNEKHLREDLNSILTDDQVETNENDENIDYEALKKESNESDYNHHIDGVTYITIVHDGESEDISEDNLQSWSKEHNLNYNIVKTLVGRPHVHHKGYRFHLNK